MYKDSIGQHEIRIGYRVKFKGEIYTIARFLPGKGRCGMAAIEFEEKQHVDEVADEISVDFINLGQTMENKNDKEFLQWIHNRMENVHGENPNFDYMHKLRSIIEAIPEEQSTPNTAE